MADKLQAVLTLANRIAEMNERKQQFHEEIDKAKPIMNLPGNLKVSSGQKIVVECFDYTVTAEPRLVIRDEDIFVEYDFQTEFKGESISIWRVYLTGDGILRCRPSDDAERVCDFNSVYVRDNIIKEVATGLLSSPVFAPATGSTNEI